ncbi:MAG TPA: VOC family protein [Solirubrobacterales bacterium]|nr:VOC family protein [Solirubrobacterales bacterium]
MAAETTAVTGVDFVAVPTRDYEQAAKFYGEVLGLPFGERWGNMPAGEFETGSLTIAVMQSDAFGLEFQPHTHPIALQVDDVQATRAELESRGVSFKGDVIDSGVCFQTFFEDPDGNSLGLHHRYAPPGAKPGDSDTGS